MHSTITSKNSHQLRNNLQRESHNPQAAPISVTRSLLLHKQTNSGTSTALSLDPPALPASQDGEFVELILPYTWVTNTYEELVRSARCSVISHDDIDNADRITPLVPEKVSHVSNQNQSVHPTSHLSTFKRGVKAGIIYLRCCTLW